MLRIHAIDTIRGLCLINIFVGHIGLGVFHLMSPSGILLIDCSDIFVFNAGVCTSLSYCCRPSLSLRQILSCNWARAAKLYCANVLLIAISAVILAVSAAIAPPDMLANWPQAIADESGAPRYLWHLISLQQSIGFSMVLRLYVFLSVVAPALIWCSLRRWWLPLVPAALVWAVAGHFALVLPNSLSGEPLSMTMLPWTFVFAAGTALGAAIVGKVPMPRMPLVDGLAIGLLVGSVLSIAVVAHILPDLQDWYRTRNDFFWTGGSKTLQSPLRVLSLFALVWVFLRFPHAPVLRLLHEAGPDALLSRLGRRPLPVFCYGAVFSLLIDQVLRLLIATGRITPTSPASVLVEAIGIAAGLAVLRWIALRPKAKPGRRSAADVAMEGSFPSVALRT